MKESYIEMRNSKKYDINWFYNYYLEHSKHQIPLEEFYQILVYSDLEQVCKHIDKKFGLTVIEDSHGNFIKIVT